MNLRCSGNSLVALACCFVITSIETASKSFLCNSTRCKPPWTVWQSSHFHDCSYWKILILLWVISENAWTLLLKKKMGKHVTGKFTQPEFKAQYFEHLEVLSTRHKPWLHDLSLATWWVAFVLTGTATPYLSCNLFIKNKQYQRPHKRSKAVHQMNKSNRPKTCIIINSLATKI